MVPAAQREDSAHKRAYVGVQFQWMRERRALERSFIRSQREAGLENLLSNLQERIFAHLRQTDRRVRELVEYFGQVTVSTLAMRSPGDVVRSLLYEERT